jgi:hypothetical protein
MKPFDENRKTNKMKIKAASASEFFQHQSSLIAQGWSFSYNFWAGWNFVAVFQKSGQFCEISRKY